MKSQAPLVLLVGLIAGAFAMPATLGGSNDGAQLAAPSAQTQDCVHMLSDCGTDGAYKYYNVCFGGAANMQRCQQCTGIAGPIPDACNTSMQQCFSSQVEAPMTNSTDQHFRGCTGQIDSAGDPTTAGLCTRKGFAGQVDNGGDDCGKHEDCDISYVKTSSCSSNFETVSS